MSSKNIIETTFFNYNTAITTFYTAITDVPIAIKKLHIHFPSLIDALQKELDVISYGDLGFQERLNYQCIQFIIKELKLWAEYNNEHYLFWFMHKYFIFSWIIFSFIERLLKITEPGKPSGTPLLLEVIAELDTLTEFFTLLDQILPYIDIITLKISFTFLEQIKNFIPIVEQYITKVLIVDSVENLHHALTRVSSIITEQSKVFLKQISNNNPVLQGIGKTFSEAYFKLYEIETDFSQLDTFVVSSEHLFQHSITTVYKKMNIQTPMNEVVKDLLEPKLSSIDSVEKKINLTIQKLHQWLSSQDIFSFPLSFPLKIRTIPLEFNEWFPEITILTTNLPDNRKKYELWINYLSEDSKQEKITLLNENRLEYWLITHVFPGDTFYSNISLRLTSPLLLQFNEAIGKKRWQKYMVLLLLEKNYFTDTGTRFSILWLVYIEFKKAVLGLQFHGDTEHQSIEEVSRKLEHIMNLKTEIAYKEMFLETLYPEESFVVWLETLRLKKLAESIVPNFSLQRFHDFLIRMGNMPMYLIYQAAEQFFHIKIPFPTIEDLIEVINRLLTYIST